MRSLPEQKKIVVFGIDPGTKKIGYSAIELVKSKPRCLGYGALVAKKPTTQPLARMEAEIARLIARFSPTHLAIERLFFGRNSRSAMAVSEARGICLLLAQKYNLPVIELGPQEIKYRICGYGLADKRAVAKMTRLLCSLPEVKALPDATDALALSVAAAFEAAHREVWG